VPRTGPHRQQGLGSIKRLDLALLIDAEHYGALGWRQIQADDVAHLLDKQWIGLKVSERCGCRPKACQIQWIVDGAWPTAFAMVRRLQCVAPCGRVSSVLQIAAAILSSPVRRGAPGRGPS